MQLLNLSVNRIIIHQIYQRDQDGNKVTPTQSNSYTKFDTEALEAFNSRVREALGENSRAVKMQIVNQDESDISKIIDKMINQDDEEFAVSSYDIAQKLTNSQQRKSIPGGIVVIFTGTQGYPKKKFLGIIKAETHSAYEKKINPKTNEISLNYIKEVLLTPSTKLYKTAGFFEKNHTESIDDLNQKFLVMISDSQIDKADGKAAAQYFYSDFLGCVVIQKQVLG